MSTNPKLTFSGHETFACKQFWLKKAYDFVAEQHQFNEEDAVVTLGVGKNMVASLRYWSKAFGIFNNDDSPSEIAEYLLGENGKDPFLEDSGTLWLLHYYLVTTNKASIYSLFFNQFRRERIDFTKEQFHAFLKRKCDEQTAYVYNRNTITTDIKVFIQNYVKPGKEGKIEIEDDFSCIFIDLNLLASFINIIDDKPVLYYRVDEQSRAALPIQIFVYSILISFSGKSTISLHELLTEFNSPGVIFCLSMAALYELIQQAITNYPEITFSETAGNQILQIKSSLTPQIILNDYYSRK